MRTVIIPTVIIVIVLAAAVARIAIVTMKIKIIFSTTYSKIEVHLKQTHAPKLPQLDEFFISLQFHTTKIKDGAATSSALSAQPSYRESSRKRD